MPFQSSNLPGAGPIFSRSNLWKAAVVRWSSPDAWAGANQRVGRRRRRRLILMIALAGRPASICCITRSRRYCDRKVATMLFELFSVGCLVSSKLFELTRIVVIFVAVILVGPNYVCCIVASLDPPSAATADWYRRRLRRFLITKYVGCLWWAPLFASPESLVHITACCLTAFYSLK